MKRAVALAATLTALAASAGPLGYEMGQKIEGGERRETTGLFRKEVPDNVPAPFKVVFLTYMPNAGLCSLHADLLTIADLVDEANRKANKAADERWRRGILAALTDKYGEPNEIDDYETSWMKTPGLGDDNLTMIQVTRRYPTSVYYRFTNHGDCWAEVKAEAEAKAKAEAESDAEALRGLL